MIISWSFLIEKEQKVFRFSPCKLSIGCIVSDYIIVYIKGCCGQVSYFQQAFCYNNDIDLDALYFQINSNGINRGGTGYEMVKYMKVTAVLPYCHGRNCSGDRRMDRCFLFARGTSGYGSDVYAEDAGGAAA